MTELAWIDAALPRPGPQAVGALLRYFRDLDTAEEAYQEACLRALKTWPDKGPPRDPAAWLIMVGRNAALDGVRRRARQSRCRPRRPLSDLDDAETAMAERLDGATTATTSCGCCSSAAIRSCRRPSRSRWRCASSPAFRCKQIARAFLVGEAAMEQRITRAKAASPRPRCLRGARRRRAGRAARGRGGDDLPAVQRGLFRERRRGGSPRAALRGGDPAGAPAAAAVPDRAGDHGADGAAAAAARPRRRRASTPTAPSCCCRIRTAACGTRP